MSTDSGLTARHLPDVGLVDHHCHGVVGHELDRPAFELFMTESDDPAPRGTSHFATPLGLSIRHHCAPLLDLEPGVDPDTYLEQRAALGADEVNRRFLQAAPYAALVVETGFRSDEIADPAEMAQMAGVPAFSVVRIERVAEQVAQAEGDPAGFADAFAARLRRDATHAVGLKSIVAYRGGFDLPVGTPSAAQVTDAAAGWLETGGRLEEPVLLRHVLHEGIAVAAERAIPLQFHAGYGDSDVVLHRVDPSRLTPWIRHAAHQGADLTLLHCYPFHREAGYLAAVYPNVYADVGLTLNYVGPAAGGILAEALELCPFTKHLFSSDAFALAELYYLGAVRFLRGMQALLEDWVTRGECSLDDAEQIMGWVCAGNAQRIYPLGELEAA